MVSLAILWYGNSLHHFTIAFAFFLKCPVTVYSLSFPLHPADCFLQASSSLHSGHLFNPIFMQLISPHLNVVLPLFPIEFHLIFSV